MEYIYRNEEEVKTMLVTALERERQQFFQNGLREGKQEGRIEGKQEGRTEGKQQGRMEEKIETAKAMLAKGMELALISEITNLPEARLLELSDSL
ncbi:MAG: ISNCY family transposase, partial [Candidatus Poribacteria bacterium]|nr:ISNCY family transposase [Candidatus Poribacteria bacterium]